MADFTPGPWRTFPASMVDGRTMRVVTERKDVGMGVGDNATETEANARLIAAAPDLYEAAVSALDYLESCLDPKCEPGCGCVLDVLRQAIAKAEGRDA